MQDERDMVGVEFVRVDRDGKLAEETVVEYVCLREIFREISREIP
jgi:hypothetical protein